MNLTLKGFSEIVEDMGAALQSAATSLIDTSVGSVIRSIFEANASIVLWLQWLLLLVLKTTRAATSTGSDLDSWMADFSFTRLPATPSTGIVTFSRFSANLPATIAVGAIVKTGDGSLSFSVSSDPSLSTWQASSGAYVIPAGVATANLPIVCTTPGEAGNVLANSITVIASSLPSVDQVINASPLSGGVDPESDAAFRTRFRAYLSSLGRATRSAVRSAATNVQQGLHILVEENMNADGLSQLGSFLVVVDDGSGSPPAALLAAVSNAIDAVRPIGTMFSVVCPQVLLVNVTLSVSLRSKVSSTGAVTAVQSAIGAYLNSLRIGKAASVTRIAQCAYAASTGIENLSGIQLNGGVEDITPPARTVVKAGTIQVTINEG